MPISIQCPNPHCGATSPVAETVSGRTVKCKRCGTPFVAGRTSDGDTTPSGDREAFPSLPAEFGRYRVRKLLGRGGMGAVYLADDTQLGREVALKIPFFDARAEPRRAERFVREARVAASLSHPNICTVFDAGTMNGRPFLTMAFVEGEPLADRFGPRSNQKRAAEVVRKVALALAHAHGKGVVHRDLKPTNILVTADGEPVVMDFGLAKRVGEGEDAKLTRDGAVLGTPAYMAPEQIKGKTGGVGPAADVYALGVVLFELITGRTPYAGQTFQMLGQILAAPTPSAEEFRPDVDPRLDAICRKAMAKEADRRYPSMLALADALGRYLADAPARKSRSRLPLLFGVCAGVAAVAAAATLLLFLLPAREPPGDNGGEGTKAGNLAAVGPIAPPTTSPPAEGSRGAGLPDGELARPQSTPQPAVGTREPKTTDGDLARLQGEWEVTSEVFKGKPIPASDLREMQKRIAFEGRRMSIRRAFKDGRRGVMEGQAVLDESATPKAIDFSGKHYFGEAAEFRGRYEVSGDELRLVYEIGAAGTGTTNRPSGFTTSEGTSALLIVARRKGAAKEMPTPTVPPRLRLSALTELPDDHHKSGIRPSSDGLTLYWSEKGPKEAFTWSATRKDHHSPFENAKRIGFGYDPAVTGDGLEMYQCQIHEFGTLWLRTRASLAAGWGQAAKVGTLNKHGALMAPYIGGAGHALICERIQKKRSPSRLVRFSRNARTDPWGPPEPITLTGIDANRVRFPALAGRNGEYLLLSYPEVPSGMVVLRQQDKRGLRYGDPRQVELPNASLHGIFARHCLPTKELFFTENVAGQAKNSIYVLRDFDPANCTKPLP